MTYDQATIELANRIGVDASAVDTLARMCASRIKDWAVDVDADSITAAVMDSNQAIRKMATKMMTNENTAESMLDFIKS